MSNDKINLIQEEINKTSQSVHDSISLVIERGDKLENLVDKSDNLNENSILFKKQAKRLRWKMFIKNLKMTALLLLVVFIIIMVILFMACGIRLQCGK